MEKEFEMFAGYHENIIACKGELTKYFGKWQQYGEFSKQEIEDYYFDEHDCDIVFTQTAFEELKDLLGLEEEYTPIFKIKGETRK